MTSTKTICEALIRRLQMLMLFPDTATDHATKTNNIHPSMESDETTTVRSVCKLVINFLSFIFIIYLNSIEQ